MSRVRAERCDYCGGRMKRCYVKEQWRVPIKNPKNGLHLILRRRSEWKPVGWYCEDCKGFKGMLVDLQREKK